MSSDPSAGLSSALRLHAASRPPVEDIPKTRILLETRSVHLAAAPDGRGSRFGAGRKLLHATDDPDMDRATFHELDARFHMALSSLAGIGVVATLMSSLRGSGLGYLKNGP